MGPGVVQNAGVLGDLAAGWTGHPVWLRSTALAASVVIAAGPSVIWKLRFPFLLTNRLQWALMPPWFHLFRDPAQAWPHVCFWLLFPCSCGWSLATYILLAPLRLVNGMFFDLILVWSVAFHDGLADLLLPPSPPGLPWHAALARWLALFPLRLLAMIRTCSYATVQGPVTVFFDIVWPTLTLFHGTDFDDASRDMATVARWKVGPGAHIGTGIYFALSQRVAEHYARSKGHPAVVVARVTFFPWRPVATLPAKQRSQIGRNGQALATSIPFPWAGLLHWRNDTGWHEFCLLERRAPGAFVHTSRVRPLCVIVRGRPRRIVGGCARWPSTLPGWVWALVTLAALPLAVSLVAESRLSASNSPLRALTPALPIGTAPQNGLPGIAVVQTLFASEGSGPWWTGSVAGGAGQRVGSVAFRHDQYVVSVLAGQTILAWPSASARLTRAGILADVRIQGHGEAGVVAGYHQGSGQQPDMWLCWVSDTGRYGCRRSVGGTWENLLSPTWGPFVRTQQSNRIALFFSRSNHAQMVVNGHTIGIVGGAVPDAGAWGVYAYSSDGSLRASYSFIDITKNVGW